MQLEQRDFIKLLLEIKSRMNAHKVIYIDRAIEDIKLALADGEIYEDEAALVRILESRVKEKVSRARGSMVKIDGMRYDGRLKETSSAFKDIDIPKVRRFLSRYNGDSRTSVIAQEYFDKSC